jgi:hypothetical protein
VSREIDEEFAEFADIEDFSMSHIANLLHYFVNAYGSHFDTDVKMNRFLVRVIATVLGDMLANFPQENKEQVITEAYDQIVHTRVLTDAFLQQQETAEDVESPMYDLSKMTPLGKA